MGPLLFRVSGGSQRGGCLLLKECLKFLKASVSPNIEIHHHLAEEKLSVLSDSTQLHQIFMNLLTNAAYAMKENGGKLEVTLDSVDILQDDIHHCG